MPPTPPPSVVFVDDETAYTDLMSHMIGAYLHCHITTFSHPTVALAALHTLHPAVIVSDYHMPDLTGFDFIRQAGAMLPTTAFILMTGHNLDGAERQLAQLPALKSVLLKPFSWRTLGDEIVRVWPAPFDRPAYRTAATAG